MILKLGKYNFGETPYPPINPNFAARKLVIKKVFNLNGNAGVHNKWPWRVNLKLKKYNFGKTPYPLINPNPKKVFNLN